MRRTLHLLTGAGRPLASAVIERQRRDPASTVTAVLLHQASAPDLPPGLDLRRIDQDLTYADLLDLIFESDQVITW